CGHTHRSHTTLFRSAAGGDLACLDEARKMYRSMFAKDPLYHVTAYEGMTQTLQTLKSRGVKLAVCTNKPHPAALGAIYGVYGKRSEEHTSELQSRFG